VCVLVRFWTEHCVHENSVPATSSIIPTETIFSIGHFSLLTFLRVFGRFVRWVLCLVPNYTVHQISLDLKCVPTVNGSDVEM